MQTSEKGKNMLSTANISVQFVRYKASRQPSARVHLGAGLGRAAADWQSYDSQAIVGLNIGDSNRHLGGGEDRGPQGFRNGRIFREAAYLGYQMECVLGRRLT